MTGTLSASGATTDITRLSRYFNFSLTGAWVGVVAVERSYDRQEWREVDTFSSNAEEVGHDPVGAWYRARFKSYTSGTAKVEFRS